VFLLIFSLVSSASWFKNYIFCVKIAIYFSLSPETDFILSLSSLIFFSYCEVIAKDSARLLYNSSFSSWSFFVCSTLSASTNSL